MGGEGEGRIRKIKEGKGGGGDNEVGDEGEN